MSQAEAVAALESAGLEGEVGDPAFSETVPPGQVVSTDPAPGDRVLDGGTVTLAISQGPERYEVPAVAGATLDEAQDRILLSTNLDYGDRVDRWTETVPEGIVIAIRPPRRDAAQAGHRRRRGREQGSPPRQVSDWTGGAPTRPSRRWSARSWSWPRGGPQRHRARGRGDRQDPPTGTLYKGDTVTLMVSLGPELVEMPRVVA